MIVSTPLHIAKLQMGLLSYDLTALYKSIIIIIIIIIIIKPLLFRFPCMWWNNTIVWDHC